jgi:hypothetical protein
MATRTIRDLLISLPKSSRYRFVCPGVFFLVFVVAMDTCE